MIRVDRMSIICSPIVTDRLWILAAADALIEVWSIDSQMVFAWIKDAALDGHEPRCVHVVSCHHSHRYTSLLTLANCLGHLHANSCNRRDPHIESEI